MRTRAERLANTKKKLKQREQMLKHFGLQGGSVYAKHREKVSSSLGYIRDGNISHYAKCGFGKKTKNSVKNGKLGSLSYGSRHNYSRHDTRQLLHGEKDYEDVIEAT